MGLIEKLKQITSRRRKRSARSARSARRRDPDYSTLPGGDSAKEAASVPPDRARELAD
jgi:hypothetical protein